MKNHKTISITSSPQITSLTTFFNELRKSFMKQGYQIIFIFTNSEIRVDNPEGMIYEDWPSKRPTKMVDLLFLGKRIKEYKSYIISSFRNISIIGGVLFCVKNRMACYHTTATQIKVDSQRYWFKN